MYHPAVCASLSRIPTKSIKLVGMLCEDYYRSSKRLLPFVDEVLVMEAAKTTGKLPILTIIGA